MPKKAIQQPTEQQLKTKHISMMTDMEKWPNWCLPLVNRTPKYTRDPLGAAGLLLDNSKPRVTLANIFAPIGNLPTAKVIEYTSFEELYDDGWRVD